MKATIHLLRTGGPHRTVPLANTEVHGNVELACPPSIPPSGAQSASCVGRGRVGSLEVPPRFITPPTRRSASVREEAAVDRVRPVAVGLAEPSLGRLAVRSGNRETRNGHCLASQGLPAVLDLEGPARTTRTSAGLLGNPGTDPPDELGESALGCVARAVSHRANLPAAATEWPSKAGGTLKPGRSRPTLPDSRQSFGSPRPVLSRRLAWMGLPIGTVRKFHAVRDFGVCGRHSLSPGLCLIARTQRQMRTSGDQRITAP
jgi:hypothetical protein